MLALLASKVVVKIRPRQTIGHDEHGTVNMWTKPEAIDMRFGFEVTMYVGINKTPALGTSER